MIERSLTCTSHSVVERESNRSCRSVLGFDDGMCIGGCRCPRQSSMSMRFDIRVNNGVECIDTKSYPRSKTILFLRESNTSGPLLFRLAGIDLQFCHIYIRISCDSSVSTDDSLRTFQCLPRRSVITRAELERRGLSKGWTLTGLKVIGVSCTGTQGNCVS